MWERILLLADILLAKKEPNEACEILERLYTYQASAAVREKLVQALLALAEGSDNEDEQLKFYERVLGLEIDRPEAKTGQQNIWQRRGEQHYKKGNLQQALEAYKNANCAEKITEIAEKMQNQAQLLELYQQAQHALKTDDKQTAQTLFAQVTAREPTYKEASRYLHLAVTGKEPDSQPRTPMAFFNKPVLIVVIVIVILTVGVVNWYEHDQIAQQLFEEIKKDEKEDERLQAEMLKFKIELEQQKTVQREQKQQHNELQKQLHKIHRGILETFLSQLESGTYVVVAASDKRFLEGKQTSQIMFERIRSAYPEFLPPQEDNDFYNYYGAGKYWNGNVWIVYIGGFYSYESAIALKDKAIKEFGIPKDAFVRNSELDRMSLKEVKSITRFLSKRESGKYVVTVASYSSLDEEEQAQNMVEQIKSTYPKLFPPQENNDFYNDYGAGKYWNGKVWRVYIGGFYSYESATALKDKAIKEFGMPKDASVINSEWDRISLKEGKSITRFLSTLESGTHVVVVASYRSFDEKEPAQNMVEQIKSAYPELFPPQENNDFYNNYGAGKYWNGKIWRVYIGGFYSYGSAIALKDKAIKEFGMPKDTFVINSVQDR
ncbi:MAG: hypothetical protein DRR19_04840 [Candidatus Parabeggiatoa sp. nov. 1]|nr:MAG: hypothetical protein DRR19_04840 [Gammaproteobacteria bacterium]